MSTGLTYLPLQATEQMLAASGLPAEQAMQLYAKMVAAFVPHGITVRKAFICDQCECVYPDSPVSECDCAIRQSSYVEGEISYPSLELAD